MKEQPSTPPRLPANALGCFGCGLCAGVCSAKAITMRMGEDGFLRPHVDEALCRKCHACEQMCRKLAAPQPPAGAAPRACYAAYATDTALRRACSSGGVVALLAKRTVERGGVAFGVVMNGLDKAEFAAIDNVRDLPKMQGSKYLQADTTHCFEKVAAALKTGVPVLFTGLPCQVKALRLRFGFKHENLLTADIACHGVPSKNAYDAWLRELAHKHGSAVRHVHFRDKTQGWIAYRMRVEFEDGSHEIVESNPFHLLFLSRLCVNETCYACQKDATTHSSDLTACDLWGVRNLSGDEKMHGVSGVVCHTEKGMQALAALGAELYMRPISVEDAVCGNGGMRMGATPIPWQRAHLLRELRKMPVSAVYHRYFIRPGTLRRSVALFGKHMLLPDFAYRVLRGVKHLVRRGGQAG